MDILPNFPFTTSEKKRDLPISNKHGLYELPHELLKDLKLQEISGN